MPGKADARLQDSDIVLNLAAFLAAVASSVLLGHVLPAVFAALAVLAWLILAVRTVRARRAGHEPVGQRPAGARL
ncbi:hypothetical protein NJC10_01400 [Micrococcus sp. M4NT]|uniref:hypothetical protein n=1 Tax=Micrococcus sp. M4NT TaxID=2957501 RepID=UPI0029A91AFE|nr:hypothetical protein [Micrococcus sp. M4NT]MDX2340333.1 hypothetical protein [Micrococcus sp. M4NT]